MEEIDNIKINAIINGKEVECDVLFSFESNDNVYIGYTDNQKDETGRINIYCGITNPYTKRVEPVQTNDEMEMIKEAIETIRKEISK